MKLRFLIPVCSVVFSLGTISHSLAQLVPDRTLGTENSRVTSIDEFIDRIDGGAARGVNLFHSFLEFNIGEGRGVYFSNPTGIENILTRVTGNNISNIFGKLGVLGEANLWLINPNGINFGANASLDIRGSFVATTADGIRLGENGIFSAIDPQRSNLLSVQPGVLFNHALAAHTAKITNEGNLLVEDNLTLVAGNLDLQGQLIAGQNLTFQADKTIRIRDSIASPFIAQAGNDLLVQGNQVVDIFTLNHPNSGLFSGQDMVLRSANRVLGDAHYSSGGHFRIENLDGSLGGLLSPNDPVIRASGDVFLLFYEGASLHIFAGGKVEIPEYIWIQGSDPINGIVETVTLSDGSSILIDGTSEPTLDIRAGTTAVGSPLTEPPGTPTSADIRIGDIYFFDINGNPSPGKVLLTNQYNPNLNLPGGAIQVGAIINYNDLGDGGDVNLIAKGQITTADINTFTNQGGNAGQINLTSIDGAINITAGILDASTGFFAETGGNITLKAKGDITAYKIRSDGGLFGGSGHIVITSESGIVSITDGLILNSTYGTSRGGDIKITGQSIFFNNTILDASTFGAADAGSIILNANHTLFVDGDSLISSLVRPDGVGNSGGISINAGSLFVTNLSELNSSVTLDGQGRAGDVIINVRDATVFDGGFIRSRLEEGGVGRGGDILINTGSLLLTGIPEDIANANVGQFVSAGFGEGDAGNVIINARDSVTLDGRGSDIWSLLGAGNDLDRQAGNITINTGSFLIRNGARIVATNESNANDLGKGYAGDITINADSVLMNNGSGINAGSFSPGTTGTIIINTESLSMSRSVITNRQINNAEGQGGDIIINTGAFSASDRSEISSQIETVRVTNAIAGDIIIRATDSVLFDNSDGLTSIIETAGGKAGNIEISVTNGSLSLSNNARLLSTTAGQGTAGNIFVQQAESVTVDNSTISTAVKKGAVVPLNAGDNVGNIAINTGSIQISNNGKILASTAGQGDAGDVTITARNRVSVENSSVSSAVESSGIGNGGNVNINGRSITLINSASLSASTHGEGDAGSVNIKAQDTVDFNNSSASSAVELSAIGDGGNVNINGRSLNLRNGSSLLASTQGQGNAGGVSIDATGDVSLNNQSSISASTDGRGNAGSIEIAAGERVNINNSLVTTAVEAFGIGNASNININTQALTLTNRAFLSASTHGRGDAGSVNINASDRVSLQSNSTLSAATSGGAGGSILVKTNNFEASGGSQLVTTTSNQSNAGNITLAVQDDVNLSGRNSGLFANTTQESSGTGGSIFINPETVMIRDGAKVAVNSEGTGEGGNIQIVADSLSLNNQGEITAETVSNQGGNITLDIQDLLLMRYNSRISATAGTEGEGGDGGNININAPFIIGIPRENSDITANAFQGRGGNINITTNGIFGLKFRDRLTPYSDITASSEFGIDGTVELNTPGVDPTSGLTELPETLVDAEGLINQDICSIKDNQIASGSSFIITGRGGLPPNPNAPLSPSNGILEWATPSQETSQSPIVLSNQHPTTHRIIQQAQGWIVSPNGTVILTAEVPNVTLQSPAVTHPTCQ